MLTINQQKKLGEGAFSKVYEGTLQNNCVAVKVINAQTSHVNTMNVRREISILSKLKHNHIVLLLGQNRSSKYLFIVLELLENGTLENLIYSKNSLPISLCESLSEDIIAGLDYLHDLNLLHRDIKPANILLNKQNRAKITDFGFAIPLSQATNRLKLSGTLNYLSPKLAAYGLEPKAQLYNYDKSDDIWALGISLLEMLRRKEPYHGIDFADMASFCHHIVTKEHESIPPHASPFLVSIVQRCLKNDSKKRASTQDLIRAKPVPEGLKTYSGSASSWSHDKITLSNHTRSQPLKDTSVIRGINAHYFWSKANQHPVLTPHKPSIVRSEDALMNRARPFLSR